MKYQEMGMCIFYNKRDGYVLEATPDMSGTFIIPTVDDYIQMYSILRGRDRESFGVIELEFKQFEQDFMESNGNFRVNPETLELEFSYPDPNEPEVPPVFVKPLTELVKELEAKNLELETKIETTDRENKNALFEIYNLLGGE